MNRLLSVLSLTLLAGISNVQAQSTPTYNTDAAKNAATGIASALRGSSPTIQNGVIQQNGGVVQMGRTTSGSVAGQMDYYKNVTGFSGTTTTGTGRDDAIGAQGSANATFDFSCKSEASARKTAGGYVIQLAGCSFNGNDITSVSLSLCTALHKGGTCLDTSAFSDKTTIPAGTYVAIDKAQVGLGCNPTNGACRVTISGTYDMTASSSNYDVTIQQKSAGTGGDTNTAKSALTTMRTTKSSDGKSAYESAMDSHGLSMVECAQRNKEAMAAGKPTTTCDGQTTVNVGSSTANNPSCNQPKQCVRTATKTTQFTRSCTRTFQLTTNVCNFTTKTKACEITWNTVTDAKGVKTYTEQSSCSLDDVKDAVKFWSQDKKTGINCTADDPITCLKYDRTDYYSWSAVPTGQCRGEPYKVGGSCITDAAHTQTQCTSGLWFGRTKTALECVIVDMSDPYSVPTEVGHDIIQGCGVCQASQVGSTCYAGQPAEWGDPTNTSPIDATDSCSTSVLDGCSMASTDQVISDGSGLITAQRENYICSKSTTSCVEFNRPAECQSTAVNTFGTEQLGFRAANSSESMNQALAATAVANEFGRGVVDADGSSTIPLLFEGSGASCDKPTGSWGSNGYFMDCCKVSLKRPGGQFGKLNSCSEENARLAAARRANYTVYIGDWCSRKLPWPLSSCIQRTQGYCSFPGIMPRVIQEQGRAQLDQMAKADASAKKLTAPLQFSYYGTTGTWSNPVSVNGVSVAAWQWPAYCTDLGAAEKAIQADPMAKDCPTRLMNYFATCENPKGCGLLPEYPELGSEQWILSTADPLKNVTTAISHYAVVSGACDPAVSKCDYSISAWPVGVGGRAIVTKQITFPIYVSSSASQMTASGELSNVGDFMFKPVSTAVAEGSFPTQLPATVRLNFSSNGGQSWSPLDVPTTNNNELSLPGSDAKLTGSCSMDTNLCQFTMTGTATVTAMPWGPPQHPNCGGFTAGQLSVLDFSKMDFSEWLSSVASNISAPAGSEFSGMAATQMTQYNAAFQSGKDTTATLAAPQGYQVARVAPSEGFGPFAVNLKVGGYWPITYGDPAKDTDAITGVIVNWGDCTALTDASFVSQVNGQPARGYLAQHTYQAPHMISSKCGGADGNVDQGVNLTHTISLTLTTTKSGTQNITLQVKNAFDTMPGAYKQNTGNTSNQTPTSSTVIPSKLPEPKP